MASKPYKPKAVKPKAKPQAAKPPRITPGEFARRRKILELEERMARMEVKTEIMVQEMRDRLLIRSPEEE